RNNAVFGSQVYYPIVFAQFSPDMVHDYTPAGYDKDPLAINKYTGHWVHYGYGMMCVYKQDYAAVGGYNLTIQGWGGEDVDIFLQHTKSHLRVFRAMDPGLIHIYHKKHCRSSLSAKQYKMCTDSNSEGLGNVSQLFRHIMNLTERFNEE
ncbi:unnamed protein product, partial [Owenia fusiformis]